MKKALPIVFLLTCVNSFATVWNVEAGGGTGIGTPYFDPAILTIQQGDIVNWNWVSGMHNVAATSGPESFNSGSHSSPYEWSFTFTMPGTYEYECSLFSHNETQVGTITVAPLAVVEWTDEDDSLSIYPNPASDQFIIEFNGNNAVLSLISLDGKMMWTSILNSIEKGIVQLNDIPSGFYLVRLESDGIIRQSRLIIQK